jgi:hypothetical protein
VSGTCLAGLAWPGLRESTLRCCRFGLPTPLPHADCTRGRVLAEPVHSSKKTHMPQQEAQSGRGAVSIGFVSGHGFSRAEKPERETGGFSPGTIERSCNKGTALAGPNESIHRISQSRASARDRPLCRSFPLFGAQWIHLFRKEPTSQFRRSRKLANGTWAVST